MTLSMPARCATCTAIVLIDCASASARRHLALIAVDVIVRPPIADPDRRVDKTVGRAQPGFEPGEVDERLERRAGLALRLGRAIELAVVVVAAADHRAHRAVGRHRDQRALADRIASAVAGQRRRRSPPPPRACRRGSSVVTTVRSRSRRRRNRDLVGDPVGEIARARPRQATPASALSSLRSAAAACSAVM